MTKRKAFRDLDNLSKGLDPGSSQWLLEPERSEQEESGDMKQEAVPADAAHIGSCIQMKGLYLFLCLLGSH